MKKTVLFIVVFTLLAGALFAQTTNLGRFVIRLVPEGEEFKQWVKNDNILGGRRFTAGETYTLTARFTSNRDINDAWWTFVDTTEAANWWTQLITREVDDQTFEGVRANQAYTLTATFTIGATATGISGAANSWFIVVKDGTVPPVLTFTEFSLRRH